ncbi:MAG: hypothetical protein GXO91_08070 [FCB group bacterium]|nr:hypothetical protein [FCB group bacterium]
MKKISILYIILSTALLSGFTPFDPNVHDYLEGYVTISSDRLDFGDVETGTQTSLTLTIFNGGSDFLFFKTVATAGEDYSVSTPSPIMPASVFEVTVTYAPTQNLTTAGMLLIRLYNTDSDILVPLTGTGDYPGTYYDSTTDLWGEDLKAQLSDIIDGHHDLGYNTARDRMYDTIDNENCTIEGVYSGIVITACNRSEAQAQGFDTEHTWPKSMGAQSSPPKSDLHHLFPTYSQFNSTRGNLPFGNVAVSNWPSGVPNNSDSDRGYDANGVEVFEPRDIHKGDVARAMFYFALRYDNPYNFLNSQETTLRQWFYEDPVSTKEIDRNEAIYGYQYNRSPFVDHPEFLDRISSIAGTAAGQLIAPNIVLVADTLWLYSWMTQYTLSFGNTGSAGLEITQIEVTAPPFSVSENQISVPQDSTEQVIVSYFSAENGIFTGELTLNSDDPDSPSITLPVKAVNYAAGDVNTDGTVDVLDVVLMVGFIYQLEIPGAVQGLLSDVNFDGQTDVLDIVTVVDILLSN